MTNKTIRYKENPFLKDMLIPVGNKNISFSALGKDENILVNQSTGEVTGTHVVARKRVDTTKFVKTFADYVAFTFELTRAGNKALRVVMWALQHKCINKDTVVLDKYTHEEFLETWGFSEDEKAERNKKKSEQKPALSYPTFARGLGELERAKIIAKTMRTGFYFINPNLMFNGDRIAFTTVIERATEEQQELNLEEREKQQ